MFYNYILLYLIVAPSLSNVIPSTDVYSIVPETIFLILVPRPSTA